MFAMFLLGLYVGRRRIFQDIPKHMPLIRRVFWWGFPIGLVSVGVERILSYTVFREQQTTLLPQLLGDVLFTYGSTVLALSYAAGITLLAQHNRGRRLLTAWGYRASGVNRLSVWLGHAWHTVLWICLRQRLLAGTGGGHGICRFVFRNSDRVFCLVDKEIPLWTDGVAVEKPYIYADSADSSTACCRTLRGNPERPLLAQAV